MVVFWSVFQLESWCCSQWCCGTPAAGGGGGGGGQIYKAYTCACPSIAANQRNIHVYIIYSEIVTVIFTCNGRRMACVLSAPVQYNGTTITHLRGESMNVQMNRLLFLSSVLAVFCVLLTRAVILPASPAPS